MPISTASSENVNPTIDKARIKGTPSLLALTIKMTKQRIKTNRPIPKLSQPAVRKLVFLLSKLRFSSLYFSILAFSLLSSPSLDKSKPQNGQNCSPCSMSLPHFGQTFALTNCSPQCGQNF